MSGCPVPKPIFWCNNLKYLRKKIWYKVVQNLYHPNFYIRNFSGAIILFIGINIFFKYIKIIPNYSKIISLEINYMTQVINNFYRDTFLKIDKNHLTIDRNFFFGDKQFFAK